MIRIMWVPSRYKGFSFEDAVIKNQLLTNEIERTLAEVKAVKSKYETMLADFVVFENNMADITEAERTENLRAIIKHFEHLK